MAKPTSPFSAQHNIHDGIRIDTDAPAAVIFNEEAGIADLLSYAHGQLCILDEVLLALSRADSEKESLPYALQAVLRPAMEALNLASNSVQGITTLRGRHTAVTGPGA